MHFMNVPLLYLFISEVHPRFCSRSAVVASPTDAVWRSRCVAGRHRVEWRVLSQCERRVCSADPITPDRSFLMATFAGWKHLPALHHEAVLEASGPSAGAGRPLPQIAPCRTQYEACRAFGASSMRATAWTASRLHGRLSGATCCCAQRKLARTIKHSRHAAILPFLGNMSSRRPLTRSGDVMRRRG